MKKMMYTFLMLLISASSLCIEKPDSLFKIKRIKNKRDYYIIIAQRNDSLFKIVSYKAPNQDKLFREIKKGNFYYFDLGLNKKDQLRILNYLDIRRVRVGNDVIKYTKRFHYKLYGTPNLRGKYYLPPGSEIN